MKIPFLDLQAGYLELQQEIDAAVARVLQSGWYIQGPELAQFESEFASFCEARHCVGAANGLEALQLALLALGVGPGEEVIVSSNTFIATWLAVSMVGATPVPVEPDPHTHNIDPNRIEEAISTRTRVLLPTHLYGQPADLDPIIELAKRRGLRVIEDAAQAHGARYKGRRIGAHGDVVTWSFYPGKNLGAYGDGGAVTTNDASLAERVRMLGNYGSRQKYVHGERGLNSRLDPLQAAILSVKLRHLEEWNARRAAIAETYLGRLRGTGIELPYVPEWADPAWHLFVVQSPDRDVLTEQLSKSGVQTLVHYPIPPHQQHAYADSGYAGGAFPIAERLAEQVVSLPIGPHLSRAQAEHVAEAILRLAPGPVR